MISRIQLARKEHAQSRPINEDSEIRGRCSKESGTRWRSVRESGTSWYYVNVSSLRFTSVFR